MDPALLQATLDQLIRCPDCEEWWCPKHESHYAYCDCPGLFGDHECSACGEWWDLSEQTFCPFCGLKVEEDANDHE